MASKLHDLKKKNKLKLSSYIFEEPQLELGSRLLKYWTQNQAQGPI
jgi:hypothetical protein